jgi:hypothetical protein
VKYVINDQVVLSRPPKGPLVPYIASFQPGRQDRDTRWDHCGSEFGSLPILVGGLQKNRSDCTASHLGIPPRTFDIVRGDSGSAIVMPLR